MTERYKRLYKNVTNADEVRKVNDFNGDPFYHTSADSLLFLGFG